MPSASRVVGIVPDLIARTEITIDTPGQGLTEITARAAEFLKDSGGGEGALFLFVRHTSASLAIQENADPDVQRDLLTALDRLAPRDAGWVHDVEGPDDMPAHVRTMLTGVSLQVPVIEGRMALGTWQGIYLIEHRDRPHRRSVILQFVGGRR